MTGGGGFLGVALRGALVERGATIISLSKSKSGAEGETLFAPYDDLPALPDQDVVVNLAGESVVGRWTAGKKAAIYESRIETTRLLSEWIVARDHPPAVFLSASAIGIYGDKGSERLTEDSDTDPGKDFLAKVCRDWEQAASPPAWKGVRTVLLRTANVLDPSGGYLAARRKPPVTTLGSADAWLSWISRRDWVAAVLHAIDHEEVAGPLNLAAPQPATQEGFAEALARATHRRVWGRIPGWAIELVLGEFGSSVLASQRVYPAKLLATGFTHRDPELAAYFGEAFSESQ